MESIIGYGLTLTGSSTTVEDLERIDTAALNPIARRVAGAGYSVRREVLYSLADLRTIQNHYLPKVADVLDRVLRAGQTQAQENLQKYLREQGLDGQLWAPPGRFNCIRGAVRQSEEMEQGETMIYHRIRGDKQPNKVETSWRIPEKQGRKETPHHTGEGSIFAPQAEELRNSTQSQQLTFQ